MIQKQPIAASAACCTALISRAVNNGKP